MKNPSWDCHCKRFLRDTLVEKWFLNERISSKKKKKKINFYESIRLMVYTIAQKMNLSIEGRKKLIQYVKKNGKLCSISSFGIWVKKRNERKREVQYVCKWKKIWAEPTRSLFALPYRKIYLTLSLYSFLPLSPFYVSATYTNSVYTLFSISLLWNTRKHTYTVPFFFFSIFIVSIYSELCGIRFATRTKS